MLLRYAGLAGQGSEQALGLGAEPAHRRTREEIGESGMILMLLMHVLRS